MLNESVIVKDGQVQILSGVLPNPPDLFTFTVPAGGIYTLAYASNMLRVISQATPDVIKVRYGQSGAFANLVSAGLGYNLPIVVDQIQFKNTSGGDVVMSVIAGIGSVQDDRLNISGTVVTKETVAPNFTTAADVALGNATPTLIASSSSTRREIHITNLTSNAVQIRIGDSNVGATRGTEVGIGATYIISTTDAVYGYAASAGKSVSVAFVGD